MGDVGGTGAVRGMGAVGATAVAGAVGATGVRGGYYLIYDLLFMLITIDHYLNH